MQAELFSLTAIHAGICRKPGMLPCLPSTCVFSSRWAFSVKLSVESAVTSTSSLHHTEHLCKHRATAAKHRCWQTVNTLREQCAAFKSTLNCLLVLSVSSATEESCGEATGKIDGINYFIYFPSRKIGDREGISPAGAACFCFAYSCLFISHSTVSPSTAFCLLP